MNDLTVETIAKAMPANMKSSATQDLVDKLNNIVSDPVLAEQIRENFLGYTGVMRDGRFHIKDYLNAVMYVSYKLMGDSSGEAYAKTFPQRYADLVAKGTSTKDIAAYVTAYNKGKLVNLIMEQTMVPTYVLNQDIYQKAIKTQYELMTTANSEKVRCDAANSLLTHLKKPDSVKAEISLDLKESSGMNELKKTLESLAVQQRDLINQGISTKMIAAQPIVEAEYTEVGTDQTKP